MYQNRTLPPTRAARLTPAPAPQPAPNMYAQYYGTYAPPAPYTAPAAYAQQYQAAPPPAQHTPVPVQLHTVAPAAVPPPMQYAPQVPQVPVYPQHTQSHHPHHPQAQHTYSSYSYTQPQPQPQPQQAFFAAPAHVPAAPAPQPSANAIPAPVQRVNYQAPVFKTFQERKREREASLQAAAGTPPPTPPQRPRAPVPPSPATPSGRQYGAQVQGVPTPLRQAAVPLHHRNQPHPQQQQQQQHHQTPSHHRTPSHPPQTPAHHRTPSHHAPSLPPSHQPSRAPSPAPSTRSASPAPGPHAPHRSASPLPPATLAMMANRGGGRPLPPPRQSQGYQAPPSPSPRNISPPQQLSRAASPAPPTPQVPQHVPSRSVSPAPPVQQPSRSVSPAPQHAEAPVPKPPVPPILGAAAPKPSPSPPVPQVVGPSPSPSPPVPQIVAPSDPARPPSAVPARIVTPPTASAPGSPNARTLGPAGAGAKPVARPGGPKLPQPAEAFVERSDTISSVRSLDHSLGMKRTLPRPPVGVSPSRSLDRGPAAPGRAPRRASPILEGRESSRDSPILEGSEPEGPEALARRLAGVSVGGVVPGSSRATPAAANHTQAQSRPPSVSVSAPPGGIKVGQVMPGSRGSPPIPAVPTISVASPPTIAIASPPAISISVGDTIPSISIGAAAPAAPPSITVAPTSGVAFAGLPTIEVESGDTRAPARAGPSRIHPSAAILCAGCAIPIIGRIVSAMGQRWHPACFQCGVCGEALEHVSAYEHEGRPYCHLDYHDRYAHRCHHCRTPIVDARFITLDNDLGLRYYHELHFFCSECGDPFLDPSKSSAAGTEHNAAEESETSDFVIHKGHPYCERCHVRLHKPRCKACRQPIPDVAVSAMGAKWHTGCFVCAPFANNLFFPRDGKAHCTECFEGMSGR